MELVDWELARTTGRRLAGDGPQIGHTSAIETVDHLRELAIAARAPVAQCTGMHAADPEHEAATQVIGRPAWIDSNIEAMRIALGPLERKRAELHDSAADRIVASIGSRATAVQLGTALAWLSGKVLGQYEAIAGQDSHPKLLLVAPNIVATEHQLELDPHDFRMWVCLHEETHRLQFNAVDWMPDYLRGNMQTLVAGADIPASQVLRNFRPVANAMAGVLRGRNGSTEVLKAIQTPAQREVFDRLTALMTLLEGHADFVMDAVGPEIVPSVEVIRQRFDKRRESPGVFGGFVRRLLGMDAKLAQYRDGAAFVRAVVSEAGMDGFNAVWHSPETLPSGQEIGDPASWLRRVSP